MSDSDPTSTIKNQHRLVTDYKVLCDIYDSDSTTYMRSVLCFSNREELKNIRRRWVPSFLLLRVLDLLNIRILDFKDIKILIHLRYLAVWSGYRDFKFSEAGLSRLQTLILKGKYGNVMYSPNLQNMANLRHLLSDRIILIHTFPVLLNLQTISKLRVDDLLVLQSFPNLKKLACSVSEFFDFSSLTRLEALNVENDMDEPLTIVNPIRFPKTLKKLTLKGLRLPWSYMSTIQQLPNLEVLKLLDSSFKGSLWDAGDGQFCQLKFLKLEHLDIKFWETSRISFPCLRKLEVRSCKKLKEIPFDIGFISTLEHIDIDESNSSVLKSVDKIQEEQREMGNYDLHVTLVDVAPLEAFFQGDPFYE
ncbi:unnamed protein product [Lactuca virosa]|uniref:Uncharacterized protein n=1 Tax=Lactuca virosa TaxID=75947 RepID=A0AAU9MWK9_9ASTR|nr:unnamed protein product [Lactuca virosa]